MSSALSIVDEISSARVKLDYGPLNSRTLRAVEALRSTSPQERVVDGALNYIANLIVTRAGKASVRFCEVTSDDDWRRVRELRQRCYPVSLPYLVDVLEPDGSDHRDRHSFVFAVFVGDRAVATIRATTYPYETLDHVEEVELAGFLGAAWKTDYIEWGRLLVDRGYSKMRLTPALLTYAGIRLLTLTPYRHYFGYTKPNVRELISRFAIERDTLRFQIPSRGSHHYLLVKGSLSAGAVREIPNWLRRVSGKLTRADGSPSPARAVAP
jgi:hypothetical protein